MTSIDELDLLPENQKNQFTVQSKMIERAKECLQCFHNDKFSSVHGENKNLFIGFCTFVSLNKED